MDKIFSRALQEKTTPKPQQWWQYEDNDNDNSVNDDCDNEDGDNEGSDNVDSVNKDWQRKRQQRRQKQLKQQQTQRRVNLQTQMQRRRSNKGEDLVRIHPDNY